MSSTDETYTYRGGEKLPLMKSANEFVVRASPERLETLGITEAEQLSPGSSKVTTTEDELDAMMAQAENVAVTQPAYYEADSGQEFLATDRILVTFREALAPEKIDEFAGRYGLVIKETYSPRDYLFQLTAHTGMDAVALVVELTENEPSVEAAENDLNYRVQTYQFAVPVDPNYARQWHLHNRLSDPAVDARSSSRCEEAWRILDHFGSFDVVVGVTDDGCKLGHPDFDSANKFAGWGYFRGNRLIVREAIDANPAEMHKTGSNHGTSCAGVIAGEADAVLTVGAAPGCRLLPIQWESDGPSLFISDSKLLSAINYMADKVDVISNSWGSSPTNLFATTVLNRIAALATSGGRRGRGIVFLWAAGNENCPIQHTASVDVPFTRGWQFNADDTRTWVGVETSRQFRHNLVNVSNVMYVAALASNAQRSHYSNYGTGIAICAPSSNSHEYLRLSVTGLGITTTTGDGSGVTPSFGGTSSATPLVAGIAALTISANPDLTATEVISVLKRTAAKDLSMTGYARTPPANFDPTPTWDVSPVAPFDRGNFTHTGAPERTWSPWFGHGRVDAAAAVAEARRLAGNGGADQTIQIKEAPSIAIHDNNQGGIERLLNVASNGNIRDIALNVDITHTYVGDLNVNLITPNGTRIALHQRSGGDTDNLIQTYTTATTPGLASLRGQPVQGAWRLLASDLEARDVGKLNRWSLRIERDA
ncbi:S8 family serine peptidase [Methylosarcina fibrata]|uniref:S8 family serine peptidase n=1 Tax=Methylosarcina fibrata TaxID=105972 RepID=UPI0003781DE9|nr:S8 family serine peptidase [Methylosarcina fibrata]